MKNYSAMKYGYATFCIIILVLETAFAAPPYTEYGCKLDIEICKKYFCVLLLCEISFFYSSSLSIKFIYVQIIYKQIFKIRTKLRMQPIEYSFGFRLFSFTMPFHRLVFRSKCHSFVYRTYTNCKII